MVSFRPCLLFTAAILSQSDKSIGQIMPRPKRTDISGAAGSKDKKRRKKAASDAGLAEMAAGGGVSVNGVTVKKIRSKIKKARADSGKVYRCAECAFTTARIGELGQHIKARGGGGVLSRVWRIEI